MPMEQTLAPVEETTRYQCLSRLWIFVSAGRASSLSFRLISLALISTLPPPLSLSRSVSLSHAPHRRLGSPARGPPLLEGRAARLLPRGAGPARSAAAASCFLLARGAAGQGPHAAGAGPARRTAQLPASGLRAARKRSRAAGEAPGRAREAGSRFGLVNCWELVLVVHERN